MCSGKDILKVAAVGALAYFAGPALFGAEAGSGAIAGSEAFASGVGAAGGDAVGSLIASNAANWGITVAPEIAALGASAAELSAIQQISAGTTLGNTGTQAAQVAVGEGGAAKSGSGVLGALKTGAQLAPLANLAMMLGAEPTRQAQGVPSPTGPGQATQTPAPNIFKKKLQGMGDPTKVSGVGGVSDISLGKATILGS